jgi:hypothetical protein
MSALLAEVYYSVVLCEQLYFTSADSRLKLYITAALREVRRESVDRNTV